MKWKSSSIDRVFHWPGKLWVDKEKTSVLGEGGLGWAG